MLHRKRFLQAAGGAALAASFPRFAFASPQSSVTGTTFALSSDGIGAMWSVDGGTLRMVGLQDRLSGLSIALPKELFTLTFADGTAIASGAFAVTSTPEAVRTPGVATASRMAARLGESSISVDLVHAPSGAHVTWRAIASDGAQYLRQEITLSAHAAP
jgi:hypothetical protein